MLRRLFKFLWRLILMLGAMGLVGLILPRILTTLYAVDRIYQKESAPAEAIAIVFAAGLRRDGRPTPTLRVRDRVQTAASLYLSGKVERLLMSGDGQTRFQAKPNPCMWINSILFMLNSASGLPHLGDSHIHRVVVQTMYLWISRGYLWISALPCGEVPFRSEISLNPYPHI